MSMGKHKKYEERHNIVSIFTRKVRKTRKVVSFTRKVWVSDKKPLDMYGRIIY
jgi:hypothetical protein